MCRREGAAGIWILASPLSKAGPSILRVSFEIEDSDIVCTLDIDALQLRYRPSISKVSDIELI
jgi:hypothetical protein